MLGPGAGGGRVLDDMVESEFWTFFLCFFLVEREGREGGGGGLRG